MSRLLRSALILLLLAAALVTGFQLRISLNQLLLRQLHVGESAPVPEWERGLERQIALPAQPPAPLLAEGHAVPGSSASARAVRSVTFTYDATARLTSIQDAGGAANFYAYDASGNRLSVESERSLFLPYVQGNAP